MTSGGPRSVKGLDPQARAILQDLARREGLTTADLLQRLMAEEGPEEVASQDFFQQTVTHPYLAMPRGRTSDPERIEAPGSTLMTLLWVLRTTASSTVVARW